jgi:S-phase kinase-associated protein 1
MNPMSLDDFENDGFLTILSNDDQQVKISSNAALNSMLIKSALEDEKVSTLSLNLPAEMIAKVVEYLEHYSDPNTPRSVISKPLSKTLRSSGVLEWDEKFIDAPKEKVLDLMHASNYMDVPGMLNLCCAKIASIIKGKTAEELEQEFGISPPFTKEERQILSDI